MQFQRGLLVRKIVTLDFDAMFDGHIVPIQHGSCGYRELHELVPILQ